MEITSYSKTSSIVVKTYINWNWCFVTKSSGRIFILVDKIRSVLVLFDLDMTGSKSKIDSLLKVDWGIQYLVFAELNAIQP